LPSGEKATLAMRTFGSSNRCSSFPVAAFQSRPVPSTLQVNKRSLFQENGAVCLVVVCERLMESSYWGTGCWEAGEAGPRVSCGASRPRAPRDGRDVLSWGHDSAPRQKTPSWQVTKVSERPQCRVSPEQLSEQGKHARPRWHWSDAVQVPHNATSVVRHWSAGTAVQAEKC